MFHPLTSADLPLLWERQQRLHVLSSEFDAFRLNAWVHWDQTMVAFWRDQFVLRISLKPGACYIAPYETAAFPELLQALMAYERAQGGTVFNFLQVEKGTFAFPDTFTATARRDLFDYLYDAQDIIQMKGRAYAAKRNQIAQFKRKYDWHFEPLTPSNRDACMAVLDAWDREHDGKVVDAERTAIRRMIDTQEDYGQSGGILFANSSPVAFAIGTHPRASMQDVVAEKALPEYTGAYSMIIQSYAAYAYSLAPFDYINREEDMGLENLRNAKLQLKPARLIERTMMTSPL